MQQVKKTTQSKNFYFTIYQYIKEKNQLPAFYDLNLKSKQALNYYITHLKDARLIDRIGYGVWKVLKEYDFKIIKTSKKIKLGSPQQHPLNKEVRGHAFMFRIKIPTIDKWELRTEYLFKQNIPHTNTKYGQRIIVKGRKVHLYNKSIVIYDKESYIANLAKDTKSLAIHELLKIIKSLETLFNVSFKINKQYLFKVCREHYALIKNALARQYDRENKRLYVFCSKGLWFTIDNSYNLHEAETLLLGEAVTDNEGVQKYFNDHKATNFKVTPSFILEAIGKTQEQLKKVVDLEDYYAENRKTHIDVLKELQQAVKQLTKVVKDK